MSLLAGLAAVASAASLTGLAGAAAVPTSEPHSLNTLAYKIFEVNSFYKSCLSLSNFGLDFFYLS